MKAAIRKMGPSESRGRGTEGGFRENGAGDSKAGLDEHGSGQVGHQVAEDDPEFSGAERDCGLDISFFALDQNLAAHEPGIADPAEQGKREDDIAESGSEHRDQSNGKEDAGEGHEQINDAHDQTVNQTAENSGKRSDQKPDEKRDCHYADADQERDTRAENHAREDVAAEFVLPEPMMSARAGQSGA